MFCPKCGKENPKDITYCRSCGEDLQVISQAMKKHLPIALVSKFDAIFEKKNEYFRRRAITSGLIGIVSLFVSLFIPLEKNFFSTFNLLVLFLGVYGLLESIYYALVYRRSLELKSKNSPSLPDNDLTDVSIFCPRCGVRNSSDENFCRDCGMGLVFTPHLQGTERYLPKYLIEKIDLTIARNETAEIKSNYKSGWSLLIVAFIILTNAALSFWTGDLGNMAIYLVIGLTIVISGAWNLIAYRRNISNLLNSESISNQNNTLDAALPTKRLSSIEANDSIDNFMSVSEATTNDLTAIENNKLKRD